MRSRLHSFAVLLLAAILLLSGCFGSDQDDLQAASFSADNSPAALYQQAADSVNTAQNIVMQISTKTVTTVGGKIFTEDSQQTLSYLNHGTPSVIGSMEEFLSYGSSKVSIREVYADGMGYFTVNGNHFAGPTSADAYTARYVPAVLLDASLYANIDCTKYDDRTLIGFSQPTAAENWAMPEGAQLVDACAIAVLDTSGNLNAYDYDITYTYGTATILMTVTAAVDTNTVPVIDVPADTTGHMALNDPDVPRLLEQACGYLLQAQSVGATATETITCQAFAIDRSQTTQLTMSTKDSQLDVQLDTTVNQVNQSRGGETTNISQTEYFRDGIYTIATNGGEPVPNEAVTGDTMLTYCQDILVGSIMLPEYITSAAITETDTTIRLSFQASEALAEAICSKVCQTLYNDPALLNDLASSYKTDIIECYLEIDKFTGLPTSSGINYSGTHTIEGSAYLLTSKLDQTYQFTE